MGKGVDAKLWLRFFLFFFYERQNPSEMTELIQDSKDPGVHAVLAQLGTLRDSPRFMRLECLENIQTWFSKKSQTYVYITLRNINYQR